MSLHFRFSRLQYRYCRSSHQTHVFPSALQSHGPLRPPMAQHCPSLMLWQHAIPLLTELPSVLLALPFCLTPSHPLNLRSCLVKRPIFRGVFPEMRLLCCSAQDFNSTLDHSYHCFFFKTYTSELRAGFPDAYSHGRRDGISMLSLFSLYPKHKAWHSQVIRSFIINLVHPQTQSLFIHSTSTNQDKG